MHATTNRLVGTHGWPRSASAVQHDGKRRVTAEEDAGPSYRQPVGIERYGRCLGEESLDRDARLEAGKRRTDAEVEAAAEREVGSKLGFGQGLMRAPGLL